MKKIYKIGLILGVSCLAVGASVTLALNSDKVLLSHAEKEYQLIFDKNTNPVTGINATYDSITAEGGAGVYGGEYSLFNVKTQDGNDGLQFIAEGAFMHTDCVVGLAYDGGFGNFFNIKYPNHGKITGLKTLEVAYTGAPLQVSYGFEEDLDAGNYLVNSQPLTSGAAYNFDNSYPSYFKITTNNLDYSFIQSIKITYSCDSGLQNRPNNVLDDGYAYGSLIDANTAYAKTAHSDLEVAQILEEGIAKHYQVTQITYDYDNAEPISKTISDRRNFSHVMIVSTTDVNTRGSVVSFINLFAGDRLVNNDSLFGLAPEEGIHGFIYHYDVASYYTTTTEQYVFEKYANARSLIRRDYANANNLLRTDDFNDYPIDKLSDDQLFDVYNSEDLWWAVQHDYKPRFMVLNSTAEWIYNEAKKILKDIIYDGMSNYEKVRAIFEWLTSNITYDYDALESGRALYENQCYFLEGVFERRRAVCDGFSKAFVLMGKIEGLDVVRGVGFTQPIEPGQSSSGHAWGYFREDPSKEYHLICPTWGTAAFKPKGTNYKVSYTSYDSFMMPTTYFSDVTGGKNNYIDLLNTDKPLATTQYHTNSYDLDNLPSNPTYDYFIDNEAEMIAVLQEAFRVCPNMNFSLCVVIPDKEYAKKVNSYLTQAGIDASLYDVWTYGYLSYGVQQMEMVFHLK